MKPTILTDKPPYRFKANGAVEIHCPNRHCDRFHVEHAPAMPGDWFRWPCKNCGPVEVRLPDELPMPHAA